MAVQHLRRCFTPDLLIKGKVYPTRFILDALCWYHQGYGVGETLEKIKQRYGRAPHENAVWKWLDEYSDLCTGRRFRFRMKRRFRPNQIVRSAKFYHDRHAYTYSVHEGKLTDYIDSPTTIDAGEISQNSHLKVMQNYLENLLVDSAV